MKKFFAGWVACSAVTSLLQDALGKEQYIESVRENWIDAQITVPVALIALVWAVKVVRS